MKKSVFLILCLVPAVAGASGTLTYDGGELRAAYTHVAVSVDGDIARTTVTQVFVNDLPHAVEVSYGFPLPADASVTGLAEWHDGVRVAARAEDKDAATAAFEHAASEGKRAGLAEAEGARFRLRLAAVPGHGVRRVELAYAQTLEALGGERSYVFPAARAEGAPPSNLDVEVTVAAGAELTGVVSENHPDARIERGAADAFVARLARSGAGLERDLALRWTTRAAATDLAARAVRAAAGEPAYLEARFALNADPSPGARAPTDVILVVDSSLSMAGEPLARAVALADAVVAQAQPGDRVALVSFATEVATSGFAAPAAFDRAALHGLVARGHSNLEAAIDEAAELARGARNPVVVLMTDGQPTAGTLEPAARAADFAAAHVVVACFNYPSRQKFLETLLPQAQTRFVPDGPAGETAVKEIARLANAPVLEDVALEIDAPGLAARAGVVPARLAVGESARVLLRVGGDATVRLTGKIHGVPVALTAEVAVPVAPDAGGDRGLPVEWARLRVRDLERVIADKPDGPMAIVAREEIKALGKRYGLVTRFTSFVATDSVSPDDVKPGDPELRVHAPRAALGVRGVLPWGDTVECAWQEDEGLWLGRFLIPRGTADGLVAVRVFVDEQAGTKLRGVLHVRVDSKPPELVLTVEGNRLVARPKDARLLAGKADSIVRDLVDVKRVVVWVGGREVPLARRGEEEVWEAVVELPPDVHTLRMVVTDPAGNSSESAVTL